jgi:hypothetical protein
MRMRASELRTLDARRREYYLDWSGFGYVLQPWLLAGIPSTEQPVRRPGRNAGAAQAARRQAPGRGVRAGGANCERVAPEWLRTLTLVAGC